MAKSEYIVLRGKLDWAKIVGPARPHTGNPKYDKGPYWSVDITPDKESLAKLKAKGLLDKLRDPKGNDERTEKFMSLKVLENRSDGTKNVAPKIVDARGQAWDGSLIGNGSIGDLKVRVVDYDGAESGVYLQAVRILDHVPYEQATFAPLSEDDAFFAEAENNDSEVPSSAVETDLDDDVPF